MAVNSKAMGRRIKAARKKAAMTQARLAEEVGISEVHVSNLESGTGNPSLATLVDIANVLSVSTDELLCDPYFRRKFWKLPRTVTIMRSVC